MYNRYKEEGLNDFTIYLTEKCNFDCSYCYNKKDFVSSLNFNQVKDGLNLFLDKLIEENKEFTITILGGEPLLELDLLFKIISLIGRESKKRNIRINTIVFTNGSLLTKNIVKRMQEKNVKIYLSLDGIKESNDSYRFLKNNKKDSAFDSVIKKIGALSKEEISKIGINMVVGPKNCKYLLKNILFFQKLGFYNIDISLMSYAKWPKKSLVELKKKMRLLIKYYIWLFSGQNKIKPFKMYQLQSLVNNGGWSKMNECRRVKLAPDGNFYFCDTFFSVSAKKRKNYCVGNLNTGISVKKICDLKSKSENALSKLYKKMFKLHKENKMIYCPYGVYYYTKVKNLDLKEFLKNFYMFSYIYSKSLHRIYFHLKGNQLFKEVYSNKKGPNDYLK